MSKRFIDTNMFSDSWFSELSPSTKLFYIYLITKCDHAGIIDLNLRLAEFETGIKQLAKSYPTVKQELGNRLLSLKNGNYHILPKFVKFQYPRGLNESVKAQNSVINRLKSFSLDYNSLLTVKQELGNCSLTVQDKDKDKDKDKDTCLTFEVFYDMYDKKVSMQKAKDLFEKVSEENRQLILANVNAFVLATPNKQYRKAPDVWLRNKCWNDEIITQKPTGHQAGNTKDVDAINNCTEWKMP